jgi:hypothetical protein
LLHEPHRADSHADEGHGEHDERDERRRVLRFSFRSPTGTTMIVLIMGLTNVSRVAVATTLAQTMGWDHEHLAEELDRLGAERVDLLRERMSAALSAKRSVVYSCPMLSDVEWRTLRGTLRRVELVRLVDKGEEQPPLATALTLDGHMNASVLSATIRAVLRLEKAG